MWKRLRDALWVGAVVLVAAVPAARAQQAVHEQTTAPVGVKVGGIYLADSTYRLLRTDEDGRLMIVDVDRSRDFNTPLNLFNSVVLSPGSAAQPNINLYQMGQGVNVSQYSNGALHLRWAHTSASDTDSVVVAVRVWGRMGEQTGTLMLWTPQTGVLSTTDTCYSNKAIADSASTTVFNCPSTPWSWILVRPANPITQALLTGGAVAGNRVPMNFFGGGGTGNTKGYSRKVPLSTVKMAGAYGMVLPLSDNAGNPCPFSYIFVEIISLNWCRSLSNVTCDFVGRAN